MKEIKIEAPKGKVIQQEETQDGLIIKFVDKWAPKDGDVVYFSDDRYTWVGIYSKKTNSDYYPFALYFSIGRSCESDEWELEYKWNCRESDDIFRPATPEEQKQLFDALAKDGKMWNSYKKEIVDAPKKGDILKWTGINKFVGVFLGMDGDFKGRARIFDPKREDPYTPNSCWIPYLVKPTESEKEECLADLKKLGKRIDENGDIVDIPKLLVPDNIHIFRAKDDNTRPLFIGFNDDKQVLGYNKKRGCWIVLPCYPFKFERVQCELVEVKREELKDGDLCFRTDKLNPNVFRSEITNYAIIDGECDVWIDETPTKGRLSWGYWYKLIQING